MPKDYRSQYQVRVDEVLRNATQYHEAYYQVKTFGGPSLHFHRRCIGLLNEPLTSERIECVYATLTFWGMHRMGSRGSKMVAFEDFESSMRELAPLVDAARKIDYRAVTENNWDVLRSLFLGIRVMASATRLVGNSKVLAHLVPDVVPPVDREYTLKYLRGNKDFTNNPEREWNLLREMLEGFFLPVVSNPGFGALAARWGSQPDCYPWDTSPMKIVDNLVIGAGKVSELV